jgi:hypothetical protein
MGSATCAIRSSVRADRDDVGRRLPDSAGIRSAPRGVAQGVRRRRAAASVFNTETGNTLPYPTVDDTGNTGDCSRSTRQVTETAVTYGVINFAAYKFSSDIVTVPVELLQDSAFDLNEHLSSVLGTRLGRVHNTYQTTGTGSSQPQGIVPAPRAASRPAACRRSRMTSCSRSSTRSIRPIATRRSAPATCSTTARFLKLRQMKDGEGRPLWQAGHGRRAGHDQRLAVLHQSGHGRDDDRPQADPLRRPEEVQGPPVKGFTLLRLVERYAELAPGRVPRLHAHGFADARRGHRSLQVHHDGVIAGNRRCRERAEPPRSLTHRISYRISHASTRHQGRVVLAQRPAAGRRHHRRAVARMDRQPRR